MRIAFIAILVTAAIGTLAGAYFARELKAPTPSTPSATARPQSSETLFSAPFNDLNGASASLAPWREKTLVVNFWATWCPPCREEMPDLSRLQERHKDVRFVGLALDTPTNVTAFAARQPVAYPLLIATGDTFALSRALGNDAQALPYTVVVKDGRIKWTKLGRVDPAQLDNYLQALTAGAPP